jgi:ABC-2 type transport system permease protein
MMNRTVRAIVAVVFILVIMFSLISICQNVSKSWKVDITEQRIYSLSNGTKAILGKLNQPITMKLYYSSTAAIKGPDQIRYFNNYYKFVRSLLEQYVSASNGMVKLEVIDPRPYSDDEVAAMRYGLKKFPITQEENFFFGLVVQTQFGVEKNIPFFSPSRQNFVEYDISYLVDTAITRQKKRIGILSSLNIMGDDVSPYMARMMQLQGQQSNGPWNIVEQLRQQYEVKRIPQDVNKIEDVDILLVIHPRDFSEQTLFAIDQFVVNGGRTIVCVDPFCVVDQPKQSPMQMQKEHDPSSELNKLMVNWGLEMPKNTFAGDRSLALEGALRAQDRPQRIIGFLETKAECFNKDTPMTSELNQVRFLYSGVLKQLQISDEDKKQIERTPLVITTSKGNSWTVDNQLEVMSPDVGNLMKKFVDGTEPVAMAYLVTGKFKSAFPNGIDIEVDAPKDANDPNAAKKVKKHIVALAAAKENCAVVVFADVDFFSDMVAYSQTIFGTMVIGDGGNLLLNAADDFCGSGELISIRSRGNFKRPFVVIDKIETEAEAQTAQEEAKINAEIAGFENELNTILGSAKQGQEEVVGSSILAKKKELELKILEARKQLKQIRKIRLQRIERLGNRLRNFNMLAAPAVILAIAIILGIYKGAKKRRYISHASDA